MHLPINYPFMVYLILFIILALLTIGVCNFIKIRKFDKTFKYLSFLDEANMDIYGEYKKALSKYKRLLEEKKKYDRKPHKKRR